MSKSHSEFTKKKRLRSHSLNNQDNPTQREYIIGNGNTKYYFHISLEQEQNKISIKSGQGKEGLKFETNLDLESLKKKSNIFKVCYTLEEAFKIVTNLFKNRKVDIQDETKDTLELVFNIMNIIEDKEEEIQINLNKIKTNSKNSIRNSKEKMNQNVIQKENKVDNLNNEKDKDKNNIYLDFEKKIDTLFKNSKDKDNQLLRIEKNFQEIKIFHTYLKKEANNIKKIIGINKGKFPEGNDEKGPDEEEENKEKENKEEEDQKIEENAESEEQKEEEDEEEDEPDKKDKKTRKSISNFSKKKIVKIKEIKNEISKEEAKTKNIPKMIFVKNLTKKAVCKYLGDNNFEVFRTINNEILLAYGTPYNDIHFYNLKIEKITKRIPEAHDHEITNFRYAYDKIKNRDLLLSVCNYVKNIKVWNVGDLSCLVNLQGVYTNGDLFSSCFLMDEIHSKNYIISINHDKENLKIYDFNGKKINEINNSEDKSFLVDTYFNQKNKKYYIIVGNEKFIVSYNFPERTIYHKYCDNSSSWHMNFLISTKDKEVNLIESDMFGYVRIWDFNKGDLLKKLFIEKKMRLRAICLWSYKYLFVGAEDKKIKLIDLENNIEIDNLKVNDYICTIKKVETSKLGECLIFQAKVDNTKIKIWKNENSK